MALIIEWTKEAEIQLENILDYLVLNWTQKEVSRFFSDLEEGLEIISNQPLQQKASIRKPKAREYQLSPQTTLFYEFDERVVTVMMLWSNKMNPEDL